MSDKLIDQLVAELQPVKPMRGRQLWQHCALCLLVVATAIISAWGIRPDFTAAIDSGAMFWKPALFLLLLAGGISCLADISRPTGKIKPVHFLPFAASLAVLAWQSIVQTVSLDGVTYNIDPETSLYCFFTVLTGGTLASLALWHFWLRKAATQQPRVMAGLAGLTSGALVASAYALHCQADSVVFIMVHYGSAISILMLLGSLAGKRLLHW